MLSSSKPLVPERKLTFAHIAAMGTSSYDISSDSLSKTTKEEVQDKKALSGLLNYDGKSVIVEEAKDKGEDCDSKPKTPVSSKKVSAWNLTENVVSVDNGETFPNSPTPAESSQKSNFAKKSTFRRPNTGMLSFQCLLISSLSP